jgi:HK97 family phage portal protein
MRPVEWLLGWFRERAERGAQRRAASRCEDGRVAADALGRLARNPASQEVVVDSPHGKALFTRRDVPRLETIAKGLTTGERVMARSMMGGASYGFPGVWTQDRLEQVQHYKAWVYVAVKAIWDRVARLEPNLGFVTDSQRFGPQQKTFGGPRPSATDHAELRYREWRHKKSLGAVKPHEDIVPAGANHPLARLIKNPNRPDTSFDFWTELGIFFELTGNAYVWTPPTKLGLLDRTLKPAELWVIPSQWMHARVGRENLTEYYEMRPFHGGQTFYLPAAEVIHLKWKSPLHKIDGYSTLAAGAEWIDTGESVNRARFFQFKNGCYVSGNLKLGEQYHDPNDEELERLYAKFFGRFQAEHRQGLPIITPPGAEYVPLTIAPAEMGYMESSDQLRDWVLALFRVPKEVAGIQDAGSEIAMYGPLRQFAENCLMPRLTYLGQTFTEKLAHRYDSRLRWWWDDPTPDDPEQKRQDLMALGKLQAITPNEVRSEYGYPPMPGGDEIPEQAPQQQDAGVMADPSMGGFGGQSRGFGRHDTGGVGRNGHA